MSTCPRCHKWNGPVAAPAGTEPTWCVCGYAQEQREANDLRARVTELEDQIRREGKMIAAQQGLREVLNADLDRYRKALESANEICRSAFAIADREGKTTNWEAFRSRTKDSLALQHSVLFPGQ